jgi:hypothetical protein
MDDIERIDKVLSAMDKNRKSTLDVQKFLVNEVKDRDLVSYQRIISKIVGMGLAKQLSGLSTICEILPDGREIVKAGGYIKYVDKMTFGKEEALRLKKIESENAEVELRLNKFYLKWKWIPFVLSALALGISLVAIFK